MRLSTGGMQATAPTAPPMDLEDAPAAPIHHEGAPVPPRERLAWGFPIGCGVVAAITYAVARFVAPPVTPPEVPNVYAVSNLAGYGEPIGEAGVLPMPFISPPIATPEIFKAPPAAARARVIPGAPHVSGRLPPAVVQRVLRQNHGRLRICYEAGLRANPNLSGRVAARLVIGRDGSVAAAQSGGTDLPDSGVVSCVVRAMYGLSFPRPDAGIATVVYPIRFAPG